MFALSPVFKVTDSVSAFDVSITRPRQMPVSAISRAKPSGCGSISARP